MATTSTDTGTNTDAAVRNGALAGALGGAATVLTGLLSQAVVMSSTTSTTVSDQRWSYPWSATAFVGVSIAYSVIHLLVVAGLVAFARSGAAGTGWLARTGVAVVVLGTATLAAAELVGIPFRQRLGSDTGPSAVAAAFAVGTVLSAVGLIMAGVATRRAGRWTGRRRHLPLAAGVWTLVLVGLAPTKALSSGVAVYGLFVMALCVAVTAESRAGRPASGAVRTRARVVR